MPSVTIRNNRFRCQIYDVDSFSEMPINNVRKLWKLMFTEAWNNEEAIETVKNWLESHTDKTAEKEAAKVMAAEYAAAMKAAAKEAADAARQAVAEYNQAKRSHAQILKLMETNQEFTRRYWF